MNDMNKKILVLPPVKEQHKKLLETAADNAVFTYSSISKISDLLIP